jgi:aminoglycoside phosphotransferase (APT) family kinase protein
MTDEETAIVEAGFERAEPIWDMACTGRLGLVHGDLTPGNVLIGDSGPILHDFENIGVGPVCWDLVRPVHAANRYTKEGDEVDAFLNAYTGHGGVPDMDMVESLAKVMDLLSTLWSLAGRLLAPEDYARAASVRLNTLATGTVSEPWPSLTRRLYRGVAVWPD